MGGYCICFAVSLYHSLYFYRYPLFKILPTFLCFDKIFLKCFIFGLKRTCGKIQNRSKCLAGCWLSAYSHDDIILAKPKRFVKSIFWRYWVWTCNFLIWFCAHMSQLTFWSHEIYSTAEIYAHHTLQVYTVSQNFLKIKLLSHICR